MYNSGYRPYPQCDTSFANMTGISSFRIDLSWGNMEQMLTDSCNNNPDSLAERIMALYPNDEDVVKLFMFKFHNKMKMADTSSHEVYKYSRFYQDDFLDMCRFIGEKLGDSTRGINNIILHNEPNWHWNPFSPPGDYGSPNWRNTPEEYATQCEECIDTILAYNPNAYIIFGSFSGVDTSGVVKAMTDSMDLNLVDCIDFHYYGDSLPSPGGAQIAAKLDTICTVSRGKDWSILETAGPCLEFPTDEEVDSATIYSYPYNYVDFIGTGNWTNSNTTVFIDSLFALTREVDACCLLLPENWFENGSCDNLEDYKILEFNRRVKRFHEHGAKFAHWFSAWRYDVDNYPYQQSGWGCSGPDCWLPTEMNTEQLTELLIKRAEWFPRNILFPDYPDSLTPLAEEMYNYINYHEHEDPRIMLPNQ
ncbi:MAG: cellulase family glycosylhydrolase, partial [bacterium]